MIKDMKDMDEKIIVSRGYLFMWRAMMVMFAGTTVIFAGIQSNMDIFYLNTALPIIGIIFTGIGLVMLGASIRYSFEIPEVLNSQEKQN